MSIVDARGREVRRATIEHNAAGLRELLELLSRAGAREVAIERPDGPVVDTLLEAGITVVVISPNQLKNLRGRYGSAGNKDDRFDAFVLADTLRTDRSRLRPLLPDTPATATELANLVLVCPYHHRAHHRGLITITGPADNLTVADSAGRPLSAGSLARASTKPPPAVAPWPGPTGERADWWWYEPFQPQPPPISN